ncbi:MAG TPA: class I SAM-dependent methyltransferase [Steroidobacteraceae bacterium]
MNDVQQANREQATLWNGSAGNAWVEMQAVLDEVFQPLEQLLVDAVSARSGGLVLDVGCGTGATTLAIARALEIRARCIGIDISDPMIAIARTRAQQEGTGVEFINGDAQLHVFEPASLDMIVSRFGVMFFDDPVRAFTNLRRAAKDNAELRFFTWRSPAENPFMTTAERAAAPLLPDIPVRQPDAPGQFAFADRRRVNRILEESGWTGIDIRPVDIPCTFAETELVRYFTQLGPLGRVLQDVDEPARVRIVETVRTAFNPYVHADAVRFNAACWMVSARPLPLSTESKETGNG